MTKSLFTLVLCVLLSNVVFGQRLSEEEVGLEALYIQANQKKLLNKYDEAIELYTKLLEKSPLNAAVHFDLARIYQGLEDTDKAIASGKKAVKYEPSNTWYRLTLATIYESGMEYRNAADQYAYLAAKENDEDLYDRWANAYIEAGDIEKAIDVYNQADAKWSPNEGRSDVKADLFLKLDKKKDAIKEVAQWVEKYPYESRYKVKLSQFYLFVNEEKKARKELEKLLKKEPNNADAMAMIQAMKTERGESNTADLTSLISNKGVSLESKIKALMPLITKGAKEDAAGLLVLTTQLSQDHQNEAPAQAAHADVLYLNGDLPAAIEYYNKTIAINKGVYEVWDQLMRCLHLTGDVDQLDKVSEDALDYYPNQAGPYYYQAQVAYARSDSKEAASLIDEALLIGGNKGMVAEQSTVLLARIANDDGDVDKAITYITSLADRLQLSTSHEFLGDLHVANGAKAEAEKAYTQALQLGGEESRIRLKLESI